MGLSKIFWNRIKKEAEIELESIKESVENLKHELETFENKLETTPFEKMTKNYAKISKAFETPNQYLLFLNSEQPKIMKYMIKRLKENMHRTEEEYIFYFTTITNFTNVNNIWKLNCIINDEECLPWLYPVAISFDRKITGPISIEWDSYITDIYKVYFQNEWWIPLWGFKHNPAPELAQNEIRIKCTAKPILYALAMEYIGGPF